MRAEISDSKFPNTIRLRKRSDFVRLLNADHKFTVKGFLIVWQSNDLMRPRLGITVSKKVGCAVIRNRIKRYIREVFRHYCSLLLSVDLNIIARRESSMMDFNTVVRELERAFRHIGISVSDKQDACVNEFIICHKSTENKFSIT